MEESANHIGTIYRKRYKMNSTEASGKTDEKPSSEGVRFRAMINRNLQGGNCAWVVFETV